MATVVKVIWGPPASGKSTYVRERKGDNDLIFDFDLLMEDLSGLDIYDRNSTLIEYLVDFRSLIIDRLGTESRLETAWLIVSYPSDELREKLDALGAEYVLMDTDQETCRQRIIDDDLRKDKAEWLRVLDEWFEKYEADQEEQNSTKGVIKMTKRKKKSPAQAKKFWEFRAQADDPKKGELLLYGEISSYTWWGDEVTPIQFKEDLDALGDVETLNVYINSGGGDVFAGQAIHSMLKRHKAHVNVYVDGLAASIASVIAMAGDRVIMPSNAMMMVHNVWTWAAGNAAEFRKLADDLDKIEESAIAAYRAKTGLDDEELKELLDAETWLTAAEAVEMGFADEIEESKQIAASVRDGLAVINGCEFDLSRYKRPPKLAFLPPGDSGGADDEAPPEDEDEKLKMLALELELLSAVPF